jgi:hypothetical protein
MEEVGERGERGEREEGERGGQNSRSPQSHLSWQSLGQNLNLRQVNLQDFQILGAHTEGATLDFRTSEHAY